MFLTGNVICGFSDDYLPNPNDCGSFYQCSNGNAILMPCPPALVFNPNLSVCVRSHEYDCQSTTLEPPRTTIITESTTTIIAESTTIMVKTLREQYCNRPRPGPDDGICAGANDTYLPDPYNCHRYYHCLNGEPIQEGCGSMFGSELVWDAINNECTFSFNYDCRSICQTKKDADTCLHSYSIYRCSFCFDSDFNNDARCDDDYSDGYLVDAGCQTIVNCNYY